MNIKSDLNLKLQKQKKSIKYETTRIGGDDHSPIFECSVIFEENNYKATGKSKNDAETKVAEQILEKLNSKDKSSPKLLSPKEVVLSSSESMPSKKIIFVDLENVPQIKDYPEIIKNNKVIGFTSKFSSVYTNIEKYEGIEIHTTESGVKNAADVLMIFHITSYLLDRMCGNDIIILSKDLFSVAFKDILEERLKINIRHISTPRDI